FSPLFPPGRPVGTRTFAPESLTDTIRLPVANRVVLRNVTNGFPLRIGLPLVGSKPADLAILSTQTASGVSLVFRASLDTAATPVTVNPLSHSPSNEAFLAGALADYVITPKASSPTTLTQLSLGGVPVRRTYLRFNIPASIIDSSTIVRATLQLPQQPTPNGVDRADTVPVFPVAVLAAPTVTDVFTALQFLAAPLSYGLGSFAMVPGDSGLKSIEIVSLVRTWRQVSAEV